MGLFDALARGAKATGRTLRAFRQANAYGENYQQYVDAEAAMLARTLQQDEEDRQAKREERAAREEERRYMRELREQQQEDRRSAARDRSRENYLKTAELGLVTTPSGKVFLNENAIPPTDLDPEEARALKLGLVRRGEARLGETNRKQAEQDREHEQRLADQERMARLASSLGDASFEKHRDYELSHRAPEKEPDYLEEARQTLLRTQVPGQPAPTGEAIARYAETLRSLRADAKIADRIRKQPDELFSPSPWATEQDAGPSAEGLGLEAPEAGSDGPPPHWLVPVGGKRIPFSSLPPPLQAAARAAWAEGKR